MPPAITAQALLARQDWLVLDTETTGLGTADQVVEIAVLDPSGRVLFDRLTRPTVPISPAASAVNGLVDSALELAHPWFDIFPALQETLTGHWLVAFHAAFDARMVAQTCAASGMSPPELEWICARELCVAALGLPENTGISLANACARFGIAPGGHRARSDCEALLKLLRALAGMPVGS